MILQIVFVMIALRTAGPVCLYNSDSLGVSKMNWTCFNLQPMKTIRNYYPKTMVKSMNDFCRKSYLNGKLATLFSIENLKLPHKSVWSDWPNETIVFAGFQMELSDNNGLMNEIIIHMPGSSPTKMVNGEMFRGPQLHLPDSIRREGLICPVIKVSSNLAEPQLIFESCFASPKWDSFVCETTGILKVDEENFNAICAYDATQKKCFTKNGNKDFKEKPCNCDTCDVNTWSSWGPWNSECGSALRIRFKPKDGESMQDCVQSQKLCCIQKQLQKRGPCPINTKVTSYVKNICANGGTPLLYIKNTVACLCAEGYTGQLCLEKLTENSSKKYIELHSSSTHFSFPSRRLRRLASLTDTIDCDRQNACLNGGICMNIDHKGLCRCSTGFGGRRCEYKIRSCKSLTTCRNGGKCIYKERVEQCYCPPGFTGTDCRTHILHQICVESTCLNGKCIKMDDGRMACECSDGFQGAYCGSDIDECLTSPCKNGGTCINTYGSYFCQCVAPYSGKNCEKDSTSSWSNLCRSEPCKHGLCLTTASGFKCACYAGYTGRLCDQVATVISLCQPDTCFNGGICTEIDNDIRCTCREQFTGSRCEIEISAPPRLVIAHTEGEETDYTLPIVILSVLVFVGVSACSYFIYTGRESNLDSVITEEGTDRAAVSDESISEDSGSRMREFLSMAGWKQSNSGTDTTESTTKAVTPMSPMSKSGIPKGIQKSGTPKSKPPSEKTLMISTAVEGTKGSPSPRMMKTETSLQKKLESPRMVKSPKSPKKSLQSPRMMKGEKSKEEVSRRNSLLERTKRNIRQWSFKVKTPKTSKASQSQDSKTSSISGRKSLGSRSPHLS